jgi:1-acyl-sn-glycerol-3-phosphate acyltransferase
VSVRKVVARKGAAIRVAEGLIKPTTRGLARRVDIDGDKIPATGGCIIVSNHVTKIDPLIVAHMIYDHGRIPRFLAKEAIFDLPLLGRIVRNTGQIPVPRLTDHARGAYDAAVRALHSGEAIVFYPEGTITRDPGLWPMRGKSGAARLALESGAPVIPVGHWGDQEVLAPYSLRLRPFPRKTVTLKVGDPVDLADLLEGEITPEKVSEATNRIMAALTQVVADLRGEQAPAERFDPRAAGIAEIGNPKKKSTKKNDKKGKA